VGTGYWSKFVAQAVGSGKELNYFSGGRNSGLSRHPDWQSEAVKLLEGSGLTVFNPRRADFTREPAPIYAEGFAANRDQLDQCEAVVLWFPAGRLTPVALLELGTLLTTGKPLFIGIENGYGRSIDVRLQTMLERPELQVAGTLSDLVGQVRDFYRTLKRGNT
jgi:hypothetical protein